MGTTNVPGLTFTSAGFVAPSEQAILTGVQADYNAAFGGNLNPALNTPQGQLATSTARMLANTYATVVNLFQMFDPAFAYGRAQDAIARIYFLSRKGAEPTVATCTCTGGQGIIIPVGAQAKATDGTIWTCTDGGTIDNTGTISLTFACNTLGPIPCPAGSLNKIFRAINGWDSITNPADGVLGRDTESRSQFEERRQESVAKNAIGSLNAVQGAVLDVDNVLDAYVTENTAAAPVTIRGVSVAGKSLYVAAVGGTDANIAKAIWSKKAPGCGYNGNTNVDVQDTNGAYSPPLPTYTVSFERPPGLRILFAVNLQNNVDIPADAQAQIAAAIMAAFAGADGGTRARIGSNILASRYYGPVSNLGSWAQVLTILLGSNNAANASFTGTIAGTALTTSAPTGTIAIGETISDVAGDIPPGTKITAGAGSSWTINKSLGSIGPVTMQGVTPAATLVSVNANQVPTVSADDIVVTTT